MDLWIKIVDSTAAIKRPTMPRADDLAAIQIALAQWTTGVRTQPVKTPQSVFIVAKGIHGTVDLHLDERAGRQFLESFDFDERHLNRIAR